MVTIEILALILIALALVKLIMLLYKPELWFDLLEKIYIIPQLIGLLALVSSAVVLYFLVNSGITVVEILAVSLFIALLMMMAIASYAQELFVWIRRQNMSKLIKNTWLYIIAWIILLIWGLREIFVK